MRAYLAIAVLAPLLLGGTTTAFAQDPTETPSSKSLEGKIKQTPGPGGANQAEAQPTNPKPDQPNSPADSKEQMAKDAPGTAAGTPASSTANPKNPADKQVETQKGR